MTNEIATSASASPTRARLSLAFFVVGMAIALAIFYWLGSGVLNSWDIMTVQLSESSPTPLIAAAGLISFFFICIGLSYHSSLLMAGAHIRSRAAVCIYLASLLGKYVPGKVFLFAGQVALTRRYQVTLEQSFVGFAVHHLFQAGVAALVACPLLVIAYNPGAFLGVMTITVMSLGLLVSGLWTKPFNTLQRWRRKPEFSISSPWIATRAIGWTALGWMSYGCSAIALTLLLMPQSNWSEMWRVGMAAVVAWLIGFLSLITPSGMGIREGAFVLLANLVIPEPTAMAIALLMRFLWICIEALAGPGALIYLLLRKSLPTGQAQ